MDTTLDGIEENSREIMTREQNTKRVVEAEREKADLIRPRKGKHKIKKRKKRKETSDSLIPEVGSDSNARLLQAMMRMQK